MKLAVFGNRSINNPELVKETLQDHVEGFLGDAVFLHGGAVGPQADALAFMNMLVADTVIFKPPHMVDKRLEFTPEWFGHRNRQIIDNADRILIFDNGEKDSEVSLVRQLCERWGKDYTVIVVDEIE